MGDSRFCSCMLRTDKRPVPGTLLSLRMYPFLTSRSSPAANRPCAAACQVRFGTKWPEIEKRALQPTCSGNGNDGSTRRKPTGNGIEGLQPTCSGDGNDGSTRRKPTGNGIEGLSAHVFWKAPRSKPDQLLWCPTYPETEMMAPLISTQPETE